MTAMRRRWFIFNGSPYALSLDVEEVEQDALQTPVHGDGGVSLNAYAACLNNEGHVLMPNPVSI